jgi:glycosyltransferase involved in cell wall biosynthesis
VFAGDGTVRGFARALRSALQTQAFDVIHAHQQQVAALTLLINWTRRSFGRNIVCTIHNSFQNFRFRNKMLLIPVLLLFPRVVFCSTSAYESLPAWLRILGGKRTLVIQNGVDTARVYRAVETSPRGTEVNGFRVVSVGRLIARKNPAALLEAFGRLSDSKASLVYVGDGDLKQSLLDRARRLGLKNNLLITGLVGRDDVYRYVSQGDVGVATSRGEGLPIAVLEMMACGRPVILSDIPPHREILIGVDYVPLISPDDVTGLARELQRLAEMTPEQRAVLGARCRDLVEEKFSLRRMLHSYESIYGEVRRRSRESYPDGAREGGFRRSRVRS